MPRSFLSSFGLTTNIYSYGWHILTILMDSLSSIWMRDSVWAYLKFLVFIHMVIKTKKKKIKPPHTTLNVYDDETMYNIKTLFNGINSI